MSAASRGTTAGTGTGTAKPSILRQPTAVWAIAFACVVAFMGIGLVDPILPAIAKSTSRLSSSSSSARA